MLLVSCATPVSKTSSESTNKERAEVEISLADNYGVTFDVELVEGIHGSQSFEKDLGQDDDYLISVAYSYAGFVRLSYPFNDSDPSSGHVVAFKLFRSDPKTKETLESTIVYSLFNGEETLIAEDYGVKIWMRSRNANSGASENQALDQSARKRAFDLR
ncbi:hypothetical protein SH449x_004654 [Pirellulaceae bacterium SH449]